MVLHTTLKKSPHKARRYPYESLWYRGRAPKKSAVVNARLGSVLITGATLVGLFGALHDAKKIHIFLSDKPLPGGFSTDVIVRSVGGWGERFHLGSSMVCAKGLRKGWPQAHKLLTRLVAGEAFLYALVVTV